MITENRHALFLALNLAGLAGFVDALGFLKLGGFFVSFMSGNSTRLAVAEATEGLTSNTLLPLGIITLFVIGVMLGTFAQHFIRKPRVIVILAFVALLLFSAALANAAGNSGLAIIFMIIAMGAENNVFVKEGKTNIGVTYMTGALVKIGQKLASGMIGGPKNEWIPFFILWIGLISGAVLGSVSYSMIGLHSLWIATSFAAALLAASSFSRSLNSK